MMRYTEVKTESRNTIGRAITIQQVNDIFEQVLAEHNLLGKLPFRRDNDKSTSYEVERSWGVSGTLYLRNKCENFNDLVEMETIKKLNPEITGSMYHNRYEVEFGWSSTTRDLAMATSAVDLYQKLISAGADLQTRLREYDFIIY